MEPNSPPPGDSSKREILAELYGRFERRLYGRIIRSVRNAADAEDLVQAVFLKMYTHFDSMMAHNPEAWIFTVAKREVLSHVERMQRVPAPVDYEALNLDWSGTDTRDLYRPLADGPADGERTRHPRASTPRNDVEEDVIKWVDRVGMVAAHLRVLVARGTISRTQLEDYWHNVAAGITQAELAGQRGVKQPRIAQLKRQLEIELRIAVYLCVLLGSLRPTYADDRIREYLDLFDWDDAAITEADRNVLRCAGAALSAVDGEPVLTPQAAETALHNLLLVGAAALAALHAAESVYAEMIGNPYPRCIASPCAVHAAPSA
jgi:DNA-directed RNA polymerase specialized sigma24 family protein